MNNEPAGAEAFVPADDHEEFARLPDVAKADVRRKLEVLAKRNMTPSRLYAAARTLRISYGHCLWLRLQWIDHGWKGLVNRSVAPDLTKAGLAL